MEFTAKRAFRVIQVRRVYFSVCGRTDVLLRCTSATIVETQEDCNEALD